MAYLFGDGLLVYSSQTENVYSFVKEEAALLLRIDELLYTNSLDDIYTVFPDLNKSIINEIVELLSCIEKKEKLEYEADIFLGEHTEGNRNRIWYQTDSIAFGINYPNKNIERRLHIILQHLFVKKPTVNKKVAIEFEKVNDLWTFYWNGIAFEKSVVERNLYAAVQKTMMTMAYQVKNNLISLHAAALEYKGSAVIMPAESESGKTTLTALLLKRGFSFFSDDVCSMDENGYILPLPFCMSIKEGSWNILECDYPELQRYDIYKRYDEQNIRFLFPASSMQRTPQKANFIIFPNYNEGKRTSFKRIDENAALEIISKAGYQVQKEMSEKKFDAIVRNLISLPAYRLEYSDTGEAMSIIINFLEDNN